MIVDTKFNVYSDAGGGDPDSSSATLRSYHKFLWSKPLPNGQMFALKEPPSDGYLHHSSELGEFWLGSDSITHSYKHHLRKKWLTEQIPDDVNELFDAGSTIGGFVLFPNNKIGGATINQARGVNAFIDDRFDLTLECIRLFYKKQESPLFGALSRYRGFFDLFQDFEGYIRFFLLDDLVDERWNVRFYLPFDDFETRPVLNGVEDYLKYKEGVMNFVEARNKRIEEFVTENL